MAWRTAPSRPNRVSNGAALSTGPVVVCHSNQKGRTLKWPDRQRRYTFALVRIGRIGRRMTIGKRSSRRSVSYLSCPRHGLHPEVDHLPSETGAVSALTAREEYEAGSEARRSRHSLAFWPCYRVAEDIRCSSHSRRRTFMGCDRVDHLRSPACLVDPPHESVGGLYGLCKSHSRRVHESPTCLHEGNVLPICI